MAIDGLISLRSNVGPKQTADRLKSELETLGLTLFAQIDHAAGAVGAGLALRPTELFVFGNAKGGTPLMQATQTIGIDLPLKALVWQDTGGDTWLSYNDPAWLAERHGVAETTQAVTAAMSALLGAIAKTVTSGGA
ncbi:MULTISPECIES: DUF302 domain-containing protein [unclassified Bradyrhizobium]|uniref:DUF302 domain-containing protein n=1 Tax=unclassified Bradyrhizobium TaxID=2631580 RepID=UPI0004117AAA|nr:MULTISPECIES: DUF302 domain-containing protein [unclassified Bradyrhizobium]QIG92596.1 DUF302 domain-containing protein [Bradyrhizobium sp. 6(2017)]